MDNNKALLALFAVLAITGGVYVYTTMGSSSDITNTPPQAVQPVQHPIAKTPTTPPEPTAQSSSDQIIDYMVNALTGSESVAAKTTVDAPAPSQANTVDSQVSTNF